MSADRLSSAETGQLNLAWATALVAGFVAAGVRHAVISPGSRSSPLALALLREPAFRCEVMVDERSAAFFALGIGKASGKPALLLATSGSAPAHWLPAAIEADQAGVPLLLLSADRPPELHGWGANQTIDQSALFAGFLRDRQMLGAPHAGFEAGWLHRVAARAVAAACGPLAGPVHINQPFREPLLPPAESPPIPKPTPLPAVRIAIAAPARLPTDTLAELADLLANSPGVIVCGPAPASPEFASAVTTLAERLDCPILAEPLSNLRFGPHDRRRIYCRQDRWLRRTDFVAAHRPAWILRFGDVPVGRPLQSFAALATRVVIVEPRPRWNDPAHTATDLLRADPAALCAALAALMPPAHRPQWMSAFAAAEAEAEATLASQAAPAEAALISAALAARPGTPLFVGNSLLVRDLDAFSGSGSAALEFFANRGVSGIDGNLSTAAGIAAVRGPTIALLGDLACQHDLGGLAALRGRPLAAVVVNNGGGGIFEHLPPAELAEFSTGWLTPQELDFSAAARTFGIPYRRVDDPADLGPALAASLAAGQALLCEAMVDRRVSRDLREAWWRFSP